MGQRSWGEVRTVALKKYNKSVHHIFVLACAVFSCRIFVNIAATGDVTVNWLIVSRSNLIDELL